MFLFRSGFFLYFWLLWSKKDDKKKEKMSKIPPLPYMSMSAFISGAAKKEYKINIAIEWRTEIFCTMGWKIFYEVAFWIFHQINFTILGKAICSKNSDAERNWWIPKKIFYVLLIFKFSGCILSADQMAMEFFKTSSRNSIDKSSWLFIIFWDCWRFNTS